MNPTVGTGTYHAPDLKVLTYADGEGVRIGKYCSIAAGVTIFGGGAHRTSLVSTWPFDCIMLGKSNGASRTYKRQQPTVIENDVWIAHGANIMAGITIGSGAVIGPGAVVFRDVRPYEVVRGNPAEFVRWRHHPAIAEKLLQIAWWDWPEHLVRERVEDFYGPVRAFVEKYA